MYCSQEPLLSVGGVLIQLPNTRIKLYGNESLSFKGGIIWSQFPIHYKPAKTDNGLKTKVKN